MANQKQYWQFEVFGTDPDVIGFFGDAGIIIPSGTTAERPVSPGIGHMRYNTDLSSFEGYNGSWLSFGTGSVTTFDTLLDTPGSKVGSANRVMIVNFAETDIEYSSALLLENSGRLTVPVGYESLVTADTTVPNKKYTDDQDNLQLSLTGGLMSGNLTMGSNSIVGLPLTPSSSDEAASKAYVDQIASGIDFKESCHMGTTADLPSTYDNGTLGLGATLTASTPGILPPSLTDDHSHPFVGTRILVKDQTDATENGIFEITDTGSGEEITEVVCVADVANSLDGTYWTFNDGATSFYVWYDTPAGAGDPAPGGTGITVGIITGELPDDVKSKTITAINASGALTVAYNDEVGILNLVNDNTGAVTDAAAGTSGFGVTVLLQGTGTPTPWVLTRTTDADNTPSNEVSGGMFTFTEDGATQEGAGWVLAEPSGDAVLGTDDLTFTQISGAGGAFLPLAGGTMTGTIAMGAAGIQITGDTTTATAPAYSFAGDLGTGLHQTAGASTMSMVIGTTATWNYSATALTPAVTLTQDIGSTGLKMRNVYADHFLPNFGAVGDPSYAFEGDATTGMYNDGAGGINFAVGGADALGIESDGTISVDTASYETLVLADNDVPNKKYVDDTVAAGTTLLTDADGDTKVDVEEGADDDTIRMDAGAIGTHGPITDIFSMSAAAWTVAMGTATTAVAGAPISISAGDAGGGSASGGSVTIAAGNPSTSGDGGSIILDVQSGGASGADGSISFQRDGTEFLNFAAGSAIITSPAGVAATNPGEDISITAGAGNTTGAGGTVSITAGAGGDPTADGGQVLITGGATDGASDGGEVRVKGGDGAAGSDHGANVIIEGGDGASGYGGTVIIRGGSQDTGFTVYGGTATKGNVEIYGSPAYYDDDYTGGAVNIRGGTANYASTTAGQYGGPVNITGGESYNIGGVVNITGGTGDSGYGGGDVTIAGGGVTGGYGYGGTLALVGGAGGVTGVGGAGGPLTITAGAAGGTAANGGAVTIASGVGSGTGVDGSLLFNTGATLRMEITESGELEFGGTPGTSAQVLTSNGTAAAPTWQAIPAVLPYTEAFDDGDLTAGVATITHSLGRQFVHVTVYDNSDIIIQPDLVTATSTSVTTIDLSSFGTLTGTWNVVIS